MKKVSVIAVMLCFVLMAGVVNMAFAEEKIGKDLYLSVGYKAWLNSWQASWFPSYSQGGANVLSITSPTLIASIPSASLKYKDFFISSGYFASSSYTFPKYTDVRNISGTPYRVTVEQTAKRNELDVNGGYYINPNVAFTLGYKEVNQDYTEKISGSGLTTVNYDPADTLKFSGPTIGIIGNTSVGGGFNIYGNVSYGFMKMKTTGVERDASYVSSELGFAYRVGGNFSMSLGYKYQAIKSDQSAGGSEYTGQYRVDLTEGFILGANLVF